MPQVATGVDYVLPLADAFVGEFAGIYSKGRFIPPADEIPMHGPRALLFCLGLWPAAALAQDAVDGGAYEGRPASDYISELADKDLNVRRRAAYILGQMGSPAKAAIPELVKLLEDRQSEPRWYAIDALGFFGPDAVEAVPAIVKSVESKVNDAIVRRRGARSLGRIGPAAKAAIPTLEAALSSDDNLYRVAAAQALWQIDQHKDALPTLVDVLETGDHEAAMTAALALAELRSDNPTTIAALIATLPHEDADVRQAAVDALAATGPPALLPLSAALPNLSPAAQREAATALGMILDQLRRTSFDNEQVNQRDFTVAAAPVVRTVLPALEKLLGSPETSTREAAALAMAKAGSVAIIAFIRALRTSEPSATAAAIVGLERLEAYLPRQRPLPPNAALVQSRALEQISFLFEQSQQDAAIDITRALARLIVLLDPAVVDSRYIDILEPLIQTALQSDDLATRRYADKALAQFAAAKTATESFPDSIPEPAPSSD